MKISEIYSGNWLKVEDLKGKARKLTIADVGSQEFNDDKGPKKKVVLSFRGADKQLVVNVTNANIIAENLGTDETEDWLGKQIILQPEKVQFQNQTFDAIRVRREVAVEEPEEETDELGLSSE